MNNLGLFFQFGIRLQGGPAFLRRTRTAFGQLQTRTRTCTTSISTYWAQGSKVQQCFGFPLNGRVCGGPCPNDPPGSTDICTGPNGSCGSPGIYQVYNATCIHRTNFNYGGFTAWSNTTSCNPVGGCNNTNRECRTFYSFRNEDWSAYEEVDVCTSQSPTPAAGAIEIECVPQ